MRTTLFCLLISLVISLEAFSQTIVQHRADTVKNIIFADYRFFKDKKTLDSLEFNYPNRKYIEFEDLTLKQRDSLVTQSWFNFTDSFKRSINYPAHQFKYRKSRIFFTLHFNNLGELSFVLYNWLNNIEFTSMTNHFIEFTSSYNFSSLPKGNSWSQCGTLELNRKKLKKADDKRNHP